MNRKQNRLSQQYGVALRRHLKENSHGKFQSAWRLGNEAVVLGLKTLDMARMHEQALTALPVPIGRDGLAKRAEMFFTEAITPIVETHRAARRNKIELGRLNETLNRRTKELAVANQQLQRGIARRKQVEATLKKSSRHHAKLLNASLRLQEGLRQLTHQVLAAQEAERKKISHGLQDEIAQTLLGINVRLLSLKEEAKANTKGFKNEIASTQRLVVKSANSVRRVARQFGRS
jgi:signal transduction histidine kinase